MNDTLHGHTIFISASLPSDHRSPKFTVDREHVGWIEDAVIADHSSCPRKRWSS